MLLEILGTGKFFSITTTFLTVADNCLSCGFSYLILTLISDFLCKGLFLDFGWDQETAIRSSLSIFLTETYSGSTSSGSLESDSSQVIGILIFGLFNCGQLAFSDDWLVCFVDRLIFCNFKGQIYKFSLIIFSLMSPFFFTKEVFSCGLNLIEVISALAEALSL